MPFYHRTCSSASAVKRAATRAASSANSIHTEHCWLTRIIFGQELCYWCRTQVPSWNPNFRWQCSHEYYYFDSLGRLRLSLLPNSHSPELSIASLRICDPSCAVAAASLRSPPLSRLAFLLQGCIVTHEQ